VCIFFSSYVSVPLPCDLAGRKGGELASAVHAYTKTGDPYMRSLVQHILGLVSHPVLNFLYRWIYDGELEDTYHEVMYVIQYMFYLCSFALWEYNLWEA